MGAVARPGWAYADQDGPQHNSQVLFARTMVCTRECMARGWLARRRLRPACKRSPKMRTASASPERTRSSADASEGMKIERKNRLCFRRQSVFVSVAFVVSPSRVAEVEHLDVFHSQMLKISVVREGRQ